MEEEKQEEQAVVRLPLANIEDRIAVKQLMQDAESYITRYSSCTFAESKGNYIDIYTNDDPDNPRPQSQRRVVRLRTNQNWINRELILTDIFKGRDVLLKENDDVENRIRVGYFSNQILVDAGVICPEFKATKEELDNEKKAIEDEKITPRQEEPPKDDKK